MTTDELRKIAMNATPGEWEWDSFRQGAHLGDTLICLDDTYEGHEEDLNHIATFSPARILRMLDVIEKAVEMRSNLEGDYGSGFDKALEELEK